MGPRTQESAVSGINSRSTGGLSRTQCGINDGDQKRGGCSKAVTRVYGPFKGLRVSIRPNLTSSSTGSRGRSVSWGVKDKATHPRAGWVRTGGSWGGGDGHLKGHWKRLIQTNNRPTCDGDLRNVRRTEKGEKMNETRWHRTIRPSVFPPVSPLSASSPVGLFPSSWTTRRYPMCLPLGVQVLQAYACLGLETPPWPRLSPLGSIVLPSTQDSLTGTFSRTCTHHWPMGPPCVLRPWAVTTFCV